MFRNLFITEPEQVVEINPDPRPGVNPVPLDLLRRWLDESVEVIDLGSPKRDQVIQPTTWHV